MRHVAFGDAVRLGSDVAALGLLRELAAWGVCCDWALVADVPAVDWRQFSHLPPPSSATGDGIDLEEWRSAYFPGRCLYREGPGFVQIRDRRSDSLELYTVDEPGLVAAIRDMSTGSDPDAAHPNAAELFTEDGLIVSAGRLRWWAPGRVRRWPIPAMIV